MGIGRGGFESGDVGQGGRDPWNTSPVGYISRKKCVVEYVWESKPIVPSPQTQGECQH